MRSGIGLATVVGVPLGSWVGQMIGWRGAFWALAALSALAAWPSACSSPPTNAASALHPRRTQRPAHWPHVAAPARTRPRHGLQ
ncbi:MFS transporter [Streptomyces sp. NPDC046316]|uniref:MFS transporter n=1 Tax=Streptomyces sp. NPDC046316 TaxID=3154494 RepID=UPI00340C7F10